MNSKITQILIQVAPLGLLCLLIFWFASKSLFYTIIYFIGVGIFILYIVNFIDSYFKNNHIEGVLKKIAEKNKNDVINNFINRFAHSGKKSDFEYRGYNIDDYRINDLYNELLDNGVSLRKKDIEIVLRKYIDEKETTLTRESIKIPPQFFDSLSIDGKGLENLLFRLYEAMGYKTEVIGKSGDQGGDLIANKNGERFLIQAKSYQDWETLGNGVVQQVVGAMKFYDCSKTIVISTAGDFTKGAKELARANNTELISRSRLSELLLQYLGENWG